MQREVSDSEGTPWTCVQAYAGLEDRLEGHGGEPDTERRKEQAARNGDGSVEVVCTPSGGAGTVRLTLAEGWQTRLSDEALVREIEAAQQR